MHTYLDAPAVVSALAPDEPVILNRPHAAARAARFFVEKFPGKSLYAVKANPSPDLLKVLWEAVMTPLTYRVVNFLPRAESEDYFDRDTNFTPFSLQT